MGVPDTDLMVLKMPWLQRINPEIDWQKRTVTLRKTASKDLRRNETPALQAKNAKKISTETSYKSDDRITRRKRGSYGGDQSISKEGKYQQELKETRERLNLTSASRCVRAAETLRALVI
jgi:hypothetical protein